MENEIWKDIAGYEVLYQVSNLGRVKSLGNYKSRREKILKPNPDKDGYLHVILCKNGKGKNKSVQQLVLGAFDSNPNNLTEVNHKDENKANNRLDNLEWCDPKYNRNYGTRNERIAKKLSKQVMCVETGKIYPSAKEASRQTGANRESIRECCRGELKTAGKYHWHYA